MTDRLPTDPALHAEQGRRLDLLTVGSGVWMLIGLFLDGWAHNEQRPDGFFTPWHLILYTGFAGAAAVTVRDAMLRSPQSAWRNRLRGGDRVALIGVGLFAVGAVGDLVWHETIGVETNLTALLSPTHLFLMIGGVLLLTTPFRRAWRDPQSPTSLRAFVPALVSLSLAIGVLIFFAAYASPFGRTTVATFESVSTHLHEFSQSSRPGFEQLREMWALATILFTTLIVVLPALALIKRWSPPRGSMLALFVAIGVFQAAMSEFLRSPLSIALLAAGAIAEVAVARRVDAWVFGAVVPAALWGSYMAIVAIVYDLRWSPELWAGSIVLSSALGAIIAIVAMPWPTRDDRPMTDFEGPTTARSLAHDRFGSPSGALVDSERDGLMKPVVGRKLPVDGVESSGPECSGDILATPSAIRGSAE